MPTPDPGGSTIASAPLLHRNEQLEQRLKLGLGGRPDRILTSPLGKVLKIPCPRLSPTRSRKSRSKPSIPPALKTPDRAEIKA
jgi:hypothetical protein